MKYIKDKKIPIIDSYSIKIYNNCSFCCYRLTENSIYITILVKNIIESFNDIKNLLNFNNSEYDLKVLKKSINNYNLCLFKIFNIIILILILNIYINNK
jgi:hypothetical protein